jgi:hypothetical protein
VAAVLKAVMNFFLFAENFLADLGNISFTARTLLQGIFQSVIL